AVRGHASTHLRHPPFAMRRPRCPSLACGSCWGKGTPADPSRRRAIRRPARASSPSRIGCRPATCSAPSPSTWACSPPPLPPPPPPPPPPAAPPAPPAPPPPPPPPPAPPPRHARLAHALRAPGARRRAPGLRRRREPAAVRRRLGPGRWGHASHHEPDDGLG